MILQKNLSELGIQVIKKSTLYYEEMLELSGDMMTMLDQLKEEYIHLILSERRSESWWNILFNGKESQN